MRAAVVLLLVLLAGAVGAEDVPVRGTLTLDEDLVVDRGDALVLAPGTLVVGPGRLVVHGALRAEGTAAQPVRIATGVILDGDPSVLVSTRLLGVDGAALTVHGAEVRLFEVAFDDVGTGLVADGGSDVSLRGGRFRGATGHPIDVDGGRLRFEDVLFAANARPARLVASDGADLGLANATFAAEGLEIAAVGSGRVEVATSLFTGGAAGIRVVGDGAAVVTSASNRFVGVPVAFAVDGDRVALSSGGDRFDGCRAAVQGDDRATVTEATWLGGCTLRAATAVAAEGARYPVAVGVGLVVLLLVVGAGLAPAARRMFLKDLPPEGRARLLAALGPDACSAREMARALGLPAGGALRALEEAAGRGEAVRTESGDFAAVPAPPPERGPSPTERRILHEIQTRPGRAQSDIAESLGLSRQALHYHVKKLEKEGLVAKVVRGRETLCYPKGGEPASEGSEPAP